MENLQQKRQRIASTKYNSNDYELLTPQIKKKITDEIKRETKAEKKKAYLLKHGAQKIQERNQKIAQTKKLTMKVLEKFKIFGVDKKFNSIVKIFKQFHNDITIQKLPLKIKVNDVLVITIYKNGMTREYINDISNEVSREMKKLKIFGKQYITLKYNENKYRSGKANYFGDNVNLYEPIEYEFYQSNEEDDEEQKYFNSFSMYLIENKKKKGGASNDKLNNCFYNCINEVLNLPWNNACEFKKWLKIGVNEKVDIDDIPKIEKYLKVSINVTGDYIYQTKVNNNKVINLKLINEHYTLDIKKPKEQQNNDKKISFYEKKPIIYDTSNFLAFDGTNEFLLSKEHRNDIYNWKTENILINKSKDKKLTLKDEYENFIKNADELKRETNNKINLYKTGNFKVTSLNLFYSLTKYIQPDDIKQLESEWLNNCSLGALMYAEKGEFLNVHKYDVVSMYPSIMSSIQLFPIKEGQFMHLTEDEFNNMEFLKYGIYKCKIEGKHKLFRNNNNYLYTHIDIKIAKELNLKVNLIEDDGPNFLHYAREKCLTGTEIFKNYVEYLFKLKKNGIKSAKLILNILWGSLCEKKCKSIYIDNNDKHIKILEGNIDVLKMKPFNKDVTIVEYVDNDKQFYSNFGRIKPFLLSKGRYVLYNLIKDVINDIVYYHTDGYIIKNRMDIKIGNNLGDVKYEGCHDKIVIHNLNKIKTH